MIGERIRQRIDDLGLSQSEVARRTGLNQSTINGLIRGAQRSSVHLHRIASVLRTTPAFLEGATDDPDEAALPPQPPGPVVVTMGVVLPPERALVRMFEGLLAGIDREASLDEQALLLAQRLPIGLSQVRDLLPDEVTPARELEAAVADRPMSQRQSQR